jgi:hypothetical protein
MNLNDIWTAGGILIGFQTTMIIWRINREIEIEGQARELYATSTDERKTDILTWEYWITRADWINIASAMIIFLTTFIIPSIILNCSPAEAPDMNEEIQKALTEQGYQIVSTENALASKVALHGLITGVLLLAGYIFSIIGHYKLFKRRVARFNQNGTFAVSNIEYFPTQEMITFYCTVIVCSLYILYSIYSIFLC